MCLLSHRTTDQYVLQRSRPTTRHMPRGFTLRLKFSSLRGVYQLRGRREGEQTYLYFWRSTTLSCPGPRVDQGPLTTHHSLHRVDADEACCWGSTAIRNPHPHPVNMVNGYVDFLPASSIYNIAVQGHRRTRARISWPFPTYLPIITSCPFRPSARTQRDGFCKHTSIYLYIYIYVYIYTAPLPGGRSQCRPYHTLSLHLRKCGRPRRQSRHTYIHTYYIHAAHMLPNAFLEHPMWSGGATLSTGHVVFCRLEPLSPLY